MEVKHSGKSMDQRIRDRLNPSCSPGADVHISQGEGPTRVHTAIHHSGQQQHVKPSDIRTTPTPKESSRGRFPSGKGGG
jgi:hypothetical protein